MCAVQRSRRVRRWRLVGRPRRAVRRSRRVRRWRLAGRPRRAVERSCRVRRWRLVGRPRRAVERSCRVRRCRLVGRPFRRAVQRSCRVHRCRQKTRSRLWMSRRNLSLSSSGRWGRRTVAAHVAGVCGQPQPSSRHLICIPRGPGRPGWLPTRVYHRPVQARISAYGSSNHGFAGRAPPKRPPRCVEFPTIFGTGNLASRT